MSYNLTLNETLLVLSVLVPFAASVNMLLGRFMDKRTQSLVAMVGFITPALIAIYLAFQFPSAEKFNGFAFLKTFNLGLSEIGIMLSLGVNGIGLPLYVLAGVVGAAAGMYAIQQDVERRPLYLMLLLFMQTGLMGIFISVDIFFFYFFHEFALIPTFILIAVWGGVERKRAALEMTIYLTVGAMLSLVGLIAIYSQSGVNSFNLINLRDGLNMNPASAEVFGFLLFGFGILVSLFPFHTWAPRGYANAPTPAAMLHAGVLKKFGLYGLIQIALPLVPAGEAVWQNWIIWLALGNIVLIGLVTMAQRDLKRMLGYSSVMHMGYAFLGIAAFSLIGAGGAVMMMFAHGLSVALLFMLANMIEKRTGSLDMMEMGGLGPKAPILAAFFVAATMASIGLPGFANFVGELTIFISLWQTAPWALVLAALGIIISAVYGLRAVARIFFGTETKAQAARWKDVSVTDMTLKEKIPALLLVLALLVVGLYPKLISSSLNESLDEIHPYGYQKEIVPAPQANAQEPQATSES